MKRLTEFTLEPFADDYYLVYYTLDKDADVFHREILDQLEAEYMGW